MRLERAWEPYYVPYFMLILDSPDLGGGGLYTPEYQMQAVVEMHVLRIPEFRWCFGDE
jgi:hypothetical protein